MPKEWNLGEKKLAVQKDQERALLVGVVLPKQSEQETQEFLDELEFLALTAGAVTVERFIQKIDHPDSRTFIGSGKVKEIADYIERHDIDLVIFDDDLSGKQTNNLEEAFKRKIIDRSSLILDIFARHAQTAQAKTQVDLAQMQYLLPRLRGLWTHLERQRGGIGMRGPGEKEIETDRRIVRDRIALLKERLQTIDRQAQTQRKNRETAVRVALVGYTNVGKSTIMNLLSKSEVLVENKLFATLDTTVRKVVFGQMPFLLSDTVGFIRKLPHHLVESFKSTLDEVRESDLLVHVIDVSHPQFEKHLTVVRQTLKELGADMPVLYVFNKMDLYVQRYFDEYLTDAEKTRLEEELVAHWQEQTGGNAVFLSATERQGVENLRLQLQTRIEELYTTRYPHQTKFW